MTIATYVCLKNINQLFYTQTGETLVGFVGTHINGQNNNNLISAIIALQSLLEPAKTQEIEQYINMHFYRILGLIGAQNDMNL